MNLRKPLVLSEEAKARRRICREVCAGEITLPAAQAIFLGDWRIAFGHR
jgi:hypothetical protein